jgi:hypothetical protein
MMQSKTHGSSPRVVPKESPAVLASTLPNGKRNADNEDIPLAPRIKVPNPSYGKTVAIQISIQLSHQLRAGEFIRVRLPPNPAGVPTREKTISTPSDYQKPPDKGTAELQNSIEKGSSLGFDWTPTSTQLSTSNLKREAPPQKLVFPTSHDFVSLIKTPTRPGGYVYVVKSQRLDYVKIGSRVTVPDAINPSSTSCALKALQEAAIIAGFHCRFPERAERLAHMELSPFSKITRCLECRWVSLEDMHEHRSWFEIESEVAVKSAEMWAKFVDQAYADCGTILPKWETAVKDCPLSSEWDRMEDLSRSERESKARLIQEKLEAWMKKWMVIIG